jgi:uncharacterized protein YdiU (UPF0061 family)
MSSTEAAAPRTSAPPTVRFGFDNTYARLPQTFYSRLNPTPVAAPQLIQLNVELAHFLNLDPTALATPQGIEVLAGNRIAEGSEPLAIAYAGHQFGHFVPQLGDGRANLLGEVIARDGARYDIQLKGSGPTPFSRRGDGRAALGPVLREYLLSEAMAALGVPTTRALAAVTTGQQVVRETVVPGAIFTRVAASHLRVGTFQYFATQGDVDSIRQLADFAIGRHYPQAASEPQRYLALLQGVIGRQARLVAQWMCLGFIHGVMNTDNMSISGETIDYGPCAFMEAYDPQTVFSSIDRNGRYAYSNQPAAALWNLMRLAEAMLPLLELEAGSQEAALAAANDALASFAPQFEAARAEGFCRKLGLANHQPEDMAIIEDLLHRMTANQADFTLTFRLLCDAAANVDANAKLRSLFTNPIAYDDWAATWRQRLAQDSTPPAERHRNMRQANPIFIPRNHLVEAVIQAAITRQDLQPFHNLLAVTAHPYDDGSGLEAFSTPARPDQYVTQTFCGT